MLDEIFAIRDELIDEKDYLRIGYEDLAKMATEIYKINVLSGISKQLEILNESLKKL